MLQAPSEASGKACEFFPLRHLHKHSVKHPLEGNERTDERTNEQRRDVRRQPLRSESREAESDYRVLAPDKLLLMRHNSSGTPTSKSTGSMPDGKPRHRRRFDDLSPDLALALFRVFCFFFFQIQPRSIYRFSLCPHQLMKLSFWLFIQISSRRSTESEVFESILQIISRSHERTSDFIDTQAEHMYVFPSTNRSMFSLIFLSVIRIVIPNLFPKEFSTCTELSPFPSPI